MVCCALVHLVTGGSARPVPVGSPDGGTLTVEMSTRKAMPVEGGVKGAAPLSTAPRGLLTVTSGGKSL